MAEAAITGYRTSVSLGPGESYLLTFTATARDLDAVQALAGHITDALHATESRMRADAPAEPVETSAGCWQWGVQVGDYDPVICEGSRQPDGESAEEEARATAAGNAMIRAEYPQRPAAQVVRRWISTGPWEAADTPAAEDPGIDPTAIHASG